MNLTLFRLTKDSNIPTYGVLIREDKIPFALTLERAWRDNQRTISCIPSGIYSCYRHTSPKFGNTFWVQNVPGRQEILFHKGNIDDDSHGCILIGEGFDLIKGEDGLVDSAHGFNEFMKLQNSLNSFSIQIIDGLL